MDLTESPARRHRLFVTHPPRRLGSPTPFAGSDTMQAFPEAGPSDFEGPWYVEILKQVHKVLKPRSYFEIGTNTGTTLAISRCASIAVDPSISITWEEISNGVFHKPSLNLFQMTSDDFFREQSPFDIFKSSIDLAFLDGMHRCEFLLRDFINTERHCRRNSIIVLHDCLPIEVGIASRDIDKTTPEQPHHDGWWAGDVWRTARLIKQYRPDLHITCIDARPTGLVFITNLNPDNSVLADGYNNFVREMMGWDLTKDNLAAFFQEMSLENCDEFMTDEGITAKFYL